MKSIPPFRKKILSAFTILELLMAGVITVLLGILLLTATQGVMAGYSRTQAGITRQGDLAFALDQLVADLEGLVIPNAPGAEGFRLEPENVGAVVHVPWLTFLSASTDPDISWPQPVPGATRALSYRLALQRTLPGSSTRPEAYALYRSIASAAHTFHNAMSLTNLQTQYWQSLPPAPAPTPQPPTALASLLAENIVKVEVLFQYRDASGNFVWTRPSDRISIRRDGAFLNGNLVMGGFLRAQVTLMALSPEGARRVADGVLTLAEAIDRYGETASRQTSFF